jgi:Domain of unknown function (DUF5658)
MFRDSSTVSSWWDSSATFKKCKTEKLSFVALSVADLALTLVAMYLGLAEINPFVRFMVHTPLLLLTIKLFIPVLIAWAIPGKLLWPSIVVLALVAVWNIKELVIFLM